MNGYELTRNWFNFRFENLDKCRPIHSEMYLYIVDQWNRLGQVDKFGLPTQFTMQVLGINSYNTFKKVVSELCEFGFIKVVSESTNQHQSRIIALSKIDKATNKALDKATIKAHDKATIKALDTIIEQGNNRTTEQGKEEIREASPKHYMILWLENNCPNVMKLKEPITTEQAQKLHLDYTNKLVGLKETFLAMENKHDLLKKYNSANLTVRKWMQNQKEVESPQVSKFKFPL